MFSYEFLNENIRTVLLCCRSHLLIINLTTLNQHKSRKFLYQPPHRDTITTRLGPRPSGRSCHLRTGGTGRLSRTGGKLDSVTCPSTAMIRDDLTERQREYKSYNHAVPSIALIDSLYKYIFLLVTVFYHHLSNTIYRLDSDITVSVEHYLYNII